MEYKREDFNVRYSCRDYSVIYKGKPIGGAGVAPGVKVRNTRSNRQHYLAQGQITINAILNGRISAYMQDAMDKIDAEA